MIDREYYCAIARSFIGMNCRDGSFQHVVNIYNTNGKYWYDGEGCSETAAACAIKAAAPGAPLANYAAAQVEEAKASGIWRTYGFNKGCPIYFQTTLQGVDHTGIIVDVEGGRIHTVEGNLGSAKEVVTRVYKTSDPHIVGFANIPWEDSANIELITKYQEARIADGAKINADGEYKKYTKAVTKKKPLKLGSKGETVRWLQGFLRNLNYYKGYDDGDFGRVTDAALKAFQGREGLFVDGIAAECTIEHILGV